MTKQDDKPGSAHNPGENKPGGGFGGSLGGHTSDSGPASEERPPAPELHEGPSGSTRRQPEPPTGIVGSIGSATSSTGEDSSATSNGRRRRRGCFGTALMLATVIFVGCMAWR